MADVVERLRGHVRNRGGLSRDAETGEVVLPNGAWAMMLEAATEIETLLTRLSQAGAGGGVVVKPLEWRKFDSGGTWATTDFGLSYFAQPDGSWRHRNGEPIKAGSTLNEAKAAAQADYEARILAALATPAPVSAPGHGGLCG